MHVLSLFIILCFAVLGCKQSNADSVVEAPSTPVIGKTTISPRDTLPFPESWAGTWTGDLKIWKGSTIVQSIPMETIIAPTATADEYKWVTTYDQGDSKEENVEKLYVLKIVDQEKGRYIVDEKNSILIESYLFDNKLVSWYTVGKSFIQATYEKRGPEIIFEIFAGGREPISVTGGTKLGEEEIPIVETMPYNVMQRAVLTRKD
jgi:hypothetical protein